jgi:hypothetical protein
VRRLNAFAVALVFCPILFSQNPGQPAKPTLPAEILGPPLVAWSEMQSPHPLLQLVPPVDGADRQHQSRAPEAVQIQLLVSGIIAKDGTRHILKVSQNTSIQIDDDDRVEPYEGMRVKIAGVLEARTHLLHITSIELLS